MGVKANPLALSRGQLAAALVSAWCRTAGLPVPTPEHRFAPPRLWRFDLAFVPLKLAVEFQGGGWTGGRHTRGKGFESDCEKFSTAAALGWRLMPVTYRQLDAGALWGWLEAALKPEAE